MKKAIVALLLGTLAVSSCAGIGIGKGSLSPELKVLTQRPNGGYKITETDDKVILSGQGGSTLDAINAAKFIVKSGKLLIINGDCFSNCGGLVEKVIQLGGDACVTDRALFGYHQARYDDGHYEPPYWLYRKEIVQWVTKHSKGGVWPIGWPLTTMQGDELHKFYRQCR